MIKEDFYKYYFNMHIVLNNKNDNIYEKKFFLSGRLQSRS